MKQYSHLSFRERQKIEDRLIVRKSIRWIAKQLGRSPSTISREVKRNKIRWWIWYDSEKAKVKTYQRRWRIQKKTKKIRWISKLEYIIRSYLKKWRSPEIISMRIEKEYKFKIAGITIRRYIESRFWYDIKEYLKREWYLKKYRKIKRVKWSRITRRVSIDLRPLYASNPWSKWHYECDFIESVKCDKTVLLRLVDKYSRRRIAIKLEHKWAILVRDTIKKCISEYWIKSITFDNDLSFALHWQLWVETYFCNPYSSREKWLVEWSNREYRKPRPKKTVLKNISQIDLDKYTNYLNNRPMKCLQWKSAYEVNFQFNIHYLPIDFKVLHLTW
jgi:transposase, IS30 family